MKNLVMLLTMIMPLKSLVTEGFELEWERQGDQVRFSLTAPTTGWVAVGFTETGDLMDSNLIQGRVKDGKVFIQDQFITGLGEHPPVESLAVPSRISDLEGQEENGKTTIVFSIEKEKMDKLHYNLSEGKEIHVWLAYSVSDDFDHHSRKRILRKIVL
jgi:hypothetical protein